MFDIIADSALIIDSLSTKIYTYGSQGVEIYYKHGSHHGFETNASAWTLWGTTTLYISSHTALEVLHLPQLSLNKQDTIGVYIQMVDPASNLSYNSLNQPMTRSNEQITIISGTGSSHNFSGTYYPRDWNGEVFYHYGYKSEGSCSSPLTPVYVIISSISSNLITPLNGSTVNTISPALTVQVTNTEPQNLTVTFYGKKTSAAGNNFTLIGLPDTQHYTGIAIGGIPEMFDAQTQWIVDNRTTKNIVFVSHFGDISNNGDSNTQEWDYANTSMSKLESVLLPDGIPYGVLPGNHDQIGGTVNYNTYFGVSRYSDRNYYGGHYGSDNNNNFELFSASGMDFIIIHLENEVSENARSWADALLKTYSNRRAIVVSHSILNTGTPATFTQIGQAIYDDLKDNQNLFLMLCGHNHGEGSRSDTFNGHTIYSLLADYQVYPGGGNGFLRIMEFSPQNDQISVKTYSPYINQWETDFDSEFTIPYDMQGSLPFEVIGQNTNVIPGENTSITWPNLELFENYEWYVTVSDGITNFTSNVWNFNVGLGSGQFIVNVNVSGNGSVDKKSRQNLLQHQ